MSYTISIRAILSTVSREARAKAFSTCISQLSAILVFYTVLITLSVTHRSRRHRSPWCHAHG